MWLALTVTVGLVAGCATSPPATPSASTTAAATGAPSTAVPGTPEATPSGPRLGATWADVDLGVEGEGYGVAYGEPGFVLVGRGCAVIGNCGRGQPTAWRSDDGMTWTASAMPRAGGATPSVVAFNGSYVAAGSRSQNGQLEFLFWHSTDGRDWTLLGSFERSCENGCPLLDRLAVGPNGSIIVTLEDRTHSGLGGPYRSANGTNWTRIEPTEFGYPQETPVRAADVMATGSELALVLSFGDDPAVAFSSPDGIEWRRIGPIDARAIDDLSITSDGERLAAAIASCADGTCPTTVWVQTGDGSFKSTLTGQQLRSPKLAAVGTGWILLGVDLTVEPSPLRAWTSPDGETWEEHPTGLDWSECQLRSIASGVSTVVAVGDPECSRPSVSAGTP